MAITEDEMRGIAAILSAPDARETGYATLRGRYPHIMLTRCDASDLVEDPFLTVGAFDLHLVDMTDHCVRITADPAEAHGLALALRRVPA
ncbi:hypothetical protein DLJ53_15840 [Acuticoccus sediminis]|uniref:Uncharacterized protein n=1 Tax=Acuticoccus sediminis TaxID=2184697 RepID=A0A8B2NRN7_9HYPH|nr:hypothetical protein [Acuticoccus sediminis]RAI00719.1 hypothetical protein DLJ53_15840 [Acuticoccus sediminis]